ncbi:MAG: tetratricopeptide repeat protein, partial [Bacteroidota bacterium]
VQALAVLPLEHPDPDPVTAYLRNGLTEDLTERIRRLPYLRVVPYSAVARLRDTVADLRSLGKELNIQAVVRGSILEKGDRITLRLQVVRVEDGEALWEERFEGGFASLPRALDSAARGIGQTLGMPSSGLTDRQLALRTPADGEAYRLYLQGIHHARRIARDDNALSIQLFARSLARDSSYLPSLVGLAESQLTGYERHWNESRGVLEEAERNCRRALAVDSLSAQAVSVLGSIALARGDEEAALPLLAQAVTLDPRNLPALSRLGVYYLDRDPPRAVTYLTDARRVDPTNADVVSNLAVGYAQMRDHPRALEAFREADRLRPGESDILVNLGYFYERLGMDDSARAAYTRAVKANPRNELAHENLATLLLARGLYPQAESALTNGATMLQGDYRLVYLLGLTYRLAGRREEAVRVLAHGARLAEGVARAEPALPDPAAYLALFRARLNDARGSEEAIRSALRTGGENPEVRILVSRAYAILGNRKGMLAHFLRARELSPEYDAAYLSTAVDFGAYRRDPEMLAIAAR